MTIARLSLGLVAARLIYWGYPSPKSFKWFQFSCSQLFKYTVFLVWKVAPMPLSNSFLKNDYGAEPIVHPGSCRHDLPNPSRIPSSRPLLSPG